MTSKKKEKEETKTKTKEDSEKRILYELVDESSEPITLVMGALGKAGLINQYEDESEKYNRFYIEPTITKDEFIKIIDDYK